MTTTTISKTIKDYQFTEKELKIVKRDAYIEGEYRYWLTRIWDEDLPRMMWVLLNPSIADSNDDDPTAKKCMGFAKGLGYGSIEIVNLFAYIATDPDNLKDVIEKQGKSVAIGPKTDEYIKAAAKRCNLIVLGWGNNADKFKRCKDVIELLSERELKCLKINKSTQPKHPLYAGYLDTPDVDSLLDYTIK